MAESQAPGPYDVELQEDVWVTARDGVRLATDVYLPRPRDGSPVGRVPALLSRTPYSKRQPVQTGRSGMEGYGRYFASHGYAVVIQDVRGRYKSEGRWRFQDDDGPDGVDTCAWIGKQEWSDGQVGMFGTSYPGGTQHAIALEGAPQLKTVIPVDANSNMGERGMRYHGAFELRFWNWTFTGGNLGDWGQANETSRPALEEMRDNRRLYLQNLPTRRGTTPLKHAPEYEDWLVSAMEHGANDGFWDQCYILKDPSRYKDIPVYLVGGWYDSWDGNTTANFSALTKALTSDVYLIMGPWIHGQQADHSHGQVDFGEAAAIRDQLAWRREWFDRWLKGADNSVGKTAPFSSKVRIFVMGTGDGHKTADGLLLHGGSWRDEQEWPLARTQYTDYFLHPDGTLSTQAPSQASSSTSYQFDPKDPVPSIGGNVSSAVGILVQGAWDQRGGKHIWNFTQPLPISTRNDVLVFQSAPLDTDIEVTGEIEVRLWASTDALDTDFTAKLIDVYPASADWPGGFDLNIEDGIVRGRFRADLTKEKLLTPGEVYEFTIRLYPTSNVFSKGHRIRVDISSSNFPRFDVNPNTGEPLNQHRRSFVATNTIYHDRDHPSRIILPVIPPR